VSRQTQNPERGRKLYHSRPNRYRRVQVVRPKTPRGDGNLCEVTSPTPSKRLSSDPKPREGTETFAKSPRPHRRSACRQTQNPERGRKPASGKSVRSKRFQRVVRPKTPRGDGNLHPESPYARNASNVSSDPKPREGTETRGTVPPGPAPSGSSDPKPREGTETGNCVTARLAGRLSSDPKPREGTETRKRSTSLTILFSRRQTQNPERGRKHFERELVHSPPFRSSDPKPREGTETLMVGHGRARLSGSSDPKPREGTETRRRAAAYRATDTPGRQTQNPERGRKPGNNRAGPRG
ncbi:hypothetical protein N077_02888, partial [Mycobacterium tuberculosis variant africanum MAL010131]